MRHDPLSSAGRAGEETGQAIYYVETASALYTVNLGLDLDMIGCYSKHTGGWAQLEDATKRREAALEALALLVEGMLWGAKKSRFLPSAEPESIVVVVSHPFPFNPQPGHRDDYITETVRRAAGFLRAAREASGDAFVEVHYYTAANAAAQPPESIDGLTAKRAKTPADAVLAAKAHLTKASCG